MLGDLLWYYFTCGLILIYGSWTSRVYEPMSWNDEVLMAVLIMVAWLPFGIWTIIGKVWRARRGY